MREGLSNTLAAERERLGWSQARMAEAAGISRQSYAAIESGRSVPSTTIALRLAAALGRSVAELFRLPERPSERRIATWSGTAGPVPGQRVRLTRIGGRSIGHPCAEAHRPEGPADGVVERVSESEIVVGLFEEGPPPADMAVVGCDPAFGVLVDRLRQDRGVEVSWSQCGSRSALLALARGEAHVAGVHLLDADTGAWNGPWVRALVPFPCTRVSFATWEQGLLFRPGAEARLRGIPDLAGGEVTLLNREEGSGSRALLDQALAEAGVSPSAVRGYGTAARGHLAVADGVAAGVADTGVAIHAAGRARGLDFLILREEAYELVVPDHFLDLPAVTALLDLLRRPGIRAQVEALGGYDAERMGRTAS